VDFSNETILLQPANVVALFFPKAKEAAAVEDTVAVEDIGTAAVEDIGTAVVVEDVGTAAVTNTATKQTFESIGLWCKKAVAKHLLLENVYESNLLSDISKVDYVAGNLGRTNLRPLEGLPVFVDDIFVFGYLAREECVFQKEKLHCTSGQKGAAKLVVASIANAFERALGKRVHIPTAIVPSGSTSAPGYHRLQKTAQRAQKYTTKLCRISRQEKSANSLEAIWQTTPTAPTHTSAKPSNTRTYKPEGARALKSLCMDTSKKNCRARKPQTTSRKSWSRFPRRRGGRSIRGPTPQQTVAKPSR